MACRRFFDIGAPLCIGVIVLVKAVVRALGQRRVVIKHGRIVAELFGMAQDQVAAHKRPQKLERAGPVGQSVVNFKIDAPPVTENNKLLTTGS